MKVLIFLATILIGCSSPERKVQSYELLSPGLRIQEIAPLTFVATDTDFYSSNVLVTKSIDGTVLIASSPFDSHGTRLLMDWIEKELTPKNVIAINTHFHRDGVAGNEVFHQSGVETWASEKTIRLTKIEQKKPISGMLKFVENKNLHGRIKQTRLYPAKNSFNSEIGKTFKFSDEEVEVFYPGHAHSPDNVVIYLKNKKVLFGGCMIKPGKDLGYLGVADVKQWKKAMVKLERFSPEIVVPGHGNWGGPEFLTKTKVNVIKTLQLKR